MWLARLKIALSPGAFSQVKLSLESRERVAGSTLENNFKASHFSEENNQFVFNICFVTRDPSSLVPKLKLLNSHLRTSCLLIGPEIEI